MKYKDWICEWLDGYVKPTVKEKTYINYSVMLKAHILPAIGEFELDELTLPVLQSFVFNMSDHGNAKTGGGLSPSTVSMIEGVVERSLNFAVEIGLIERHYAAHVRCPRVNVKKVECFSLSEQRKIEEDILKSSCVSFFAFPFSVSSLFPITISKRFITHSSHILAMPPFISWSTSS